MWDAIYTQDGIAGSTGKNRFLANWRDWIAYEAEGFLTAIDSAPPGASILLDEAAEAWYYKEWYEDFVRALDKASVQIGYKNLDVHLATPALGFVGKMAIWRIKSWCHVSAPGFRRGRMELLWPKRSKFDNEKYPYFETELYHRFVALPAKFYDEYRAFKVKAASERLGKYIDIAARRVDEGLSFQDIVSDVVERARARKDQDSLKGPKGQFDPSLICYVMNTSLEVGRAAAKVLRKGGSIEIDTTSRRSSGTYQSADRAGRGTKRRS